MGTGDDDNERGDQGCVERQQHSRLQRRGPAGVVGEYPGAVRADGISANGNPESADFDHCKQTNQRLCVSLADIAVVPEG